MGKFSASVSLNCPVEKVFDFLNDQRNFVDLNPHNFRNYRVVSEQSQTRTELELLTEYEVKGPAVLLNNVIQAAFERIYKRLLTDIVHKLSQAA